MEQMFKGKNEHGGVAGVLGTGMRPDLNTGPTPEALRGKEVKKNRLYLSDTTDYLHESVYGPSLGGENVFRSM